jgi:hypothetical protein
MSSQDDKDFAIRAPYIQRIAELEMELLAAYQRGRADAEREAMEQEPYGWYDTACGQMFFARHERHPSTEIALYAKPFTAQNLPTE